MADLDKRYFFAVGQQSFSIGGNDFSTVIPIADVKGNVVKNGNEEFPNRGAVWWSQRGEDRLVLSPPGCLILSDIEYSDKPERDVYRLSRPILPSFKDLLEIVTPEVPVDDPNELLDNFQMRCDHEPTNLVLVKIGDFVFGPLQAKGFPNARERHMTPDICFSKPVAPGRVYKIPVNLFQGRTGYFFTRAMVNRDSETYSGKLHQVYYEAITRELYDELCPESEVFEIVSLTDAVNSISREYLTKPERREFIERLKRFCDGSQIEPYIVERVRNFLKREDVKLSNLNEIFDALLQDERFQKQIDVALDREMQKRITSKTAMITAHAEKRTQEINEELEEIEMERRNAKAAFEAEREDRERNLEIEIEKAREKANRELDQKAQELDDLKKILDEDIVAAAGLLTDERAKLIANFILLHPVLKLLDNSGSYGIGMHGLPAPDVEKPISAKDALPPPLVFVQSKADTEPDPIPEDDFFVRFETHVSKSEFIYDNDDLIAFHLSAKEQSPVVLSGSAGTGKSSLPVLYAEALAGETGENRYLAIDVNPSWTNPSDLIGYPDAFEHRFIPASSGLLNHLIAAYQYYEACGNGAEIFTICLEELNLAQPEYYFADIMQAISRGPGQRRVSFFDPMAVRSDDPYHPYAKLDIVPNVVFVGTMNLDETTQRLSKRLLDRCNLISFGANSKLLPFSQEAATGSKLAEGRPILQSDRDRWTRSNNVPIQLVEILDIIQPELHALGCGLTQRRQNSIARFVANSESLCSVEKAIDFQLQQRVVPQIRNIHTSSAENALDELLRKVESNINAEKTLATLYALKEERAALKSTLDDE